MKEFMGKSFLLDNPTAEKLYFDVAEKEPIIDYHCHVSPREIYENKRFRNLFDLWLSGDHYKWRLMRSNGVEEEYITGSAPEKEKFKRFAATLPLAIGNPMYHWCHLELKRYFGFEGVLNEESADLVWEITEKKLAEDEMTARGIIKTSNVTFIGTTDDPVDTLEWHKLIREDENFSVTVAPTFRPDRALNVEKGDWRAYIHSLSLASGIEIDSVDRLKDALAQRMDHFESNGCLASDHGLDYLVFSLASDREVEETFQKALSGQSVTREEAEVVKTNLLLFCAREYERRGWVMQLHFNCLRNPNSRAFSTLGPDTGFDCIGPAPARDALSGLLDELYRQNALPKTILYSLDAGDNAFIDTLIGAFQGPEIAGKLQHGSAWWFNDNKAGMLEHLTSLANLSLLGNFVGMLTDSRSFLSYTRHEYFRRILCNFIGTLVENGEYPASFETLGKLVSGICYENAKKYFNIKE